MNQVVTQRPRIAKKVIYLSYASHPQSIAQAKSKAEDSKEGSKGETSFAHRQLRSMVWNLNAAALQFFPFTLALKHILQSISIMALITAITGINSFLELAGLGLKISSTVLQKELKEYSNKMKAEIDKYSNLIKSSKQIQDRIAIINSPVLKTQQNKVNISLTANIQKIQQYYESLRKLTKVQKIEYFHSLMRDMPGSQTFGQSAVSGVGHNLFGLRVIYSINSVYETHRLFKKWKESKKNTTKLQSELSNMIQDQKSQTSQALSKAADTPSIVKSQIVPFRVILTFEFLRANSGLLKWLFIEMFKFQVKFFQKSTFTFENIVTAVKLITNIADIALSIYSLIQSSDAIEKAKAQLQNLKVELRSFYNECLGVLFNIKEFLASFEAQLYSFSIFLSYIQLICTHNLLGSTEPEKYSKHINDLKIPQINEETFENIGLAKNKMDQKLSGMKISQHQRVNNNQKIYFYTTEHSFDQITLMFSNATNIIKQLEENIKIADIFNSFYRKLQEAQIIIRDLDFQRPRKLIAFLRNVSNILYNKRIPKPTQQMLIYAIENYYYSSTGKKQEQELTDRDRETIAEAVSFLTKDFPVGSGKTRIYDYQLSDFTLKLDPKQIAERDTEIQDVSMDKIMGTWPQSKMEESKRQIAKKIHVKPAEMEYLSSSIYTQNRGSATEPKWRLERVQVFSRGQKGKERYYVLYDSLTDLFAEVREGQLKKIDEKTNKQ